MNATRPSPAPFLLAFAFLFFLPSLPALAQSERGQERQREFATREEIEKRDLEVGLDERAEEPLQEIDFDYGGWVRSSYYHLRDNLRLRIFRIQDLRLWSNLVYKNTHQLFVRVYGLYTDYNAGDEYYYMEENDFNVPRLDVGYYYGDVGKALSLGLPGKLRLKAGRQYVAVGHGLALDSRGDGAAVEFENDDVKITGFMVRSIYSEDSYDRSYPDFGHNKYVYSGMEVRRKFSKQLEVYGYTLFMRDKRDSDPPTTTQKFKYDARYFGGGIQGQFGPSLIYYGEYSAERGSTYASGSIERSRIDAYAFDVGASYSFLDLRSEPTFQVQHIFGSGDSDMQTTVDTVQGNAPGTPDNTYFSYGYVDTGFAFFPLVSNIEVTRVGFRVSPFTEHGTLGDMDIGVNHYFYRKHKSTGGISDRGLDPSIPGSRLGYETDLFCTWRPFSDVSVLLQYGVFTPNGKLFPDDAKRAYFSTGLVVYF